MNQPQVLIAITPKTLSDRVSELCQELSIPVVLALPCRGTAQRAVLDMLGLERVEKQMSFSIIPPELTRRLLHGLESHIQIDRPGNGVATLLPMRSLSGHLLKLLEIAGMQTLKPSEGCKMSAEAQETPFELIVTVANNGHTELVMEAARAAGARGGTVVHAKGTGQDHAEKFFNLSLVSEKEMVFIITRKADKAALMRAILAKAGPQTPAHAVLFSLPVSEAIGLHFPDEEGEE
ncbi:MAG: P-II family nitrogen regulator [Christensenellaceae bacterium]|jgi:nitrogen regulatory protein PII|nr:P-II family nitrogen regulator [Christensenellaceae bacterium]